MDFICRKTAEARIDSYIESANKIVIYIFSANGNINLMTVITQHQNEENFV